MSLANFIHNNSPAIIDEWENFARSLIPAFGSMTPLALRNHIQDILAFTVTDMRSAQTKGEQVDKSHGEGKQNIAREPSAAETHAVLRLAGGFNLDQMVSEYRALRASVIKLWRVSKRESDNEGVNDLIRFNEAIDQQMVESIHYYAKNLDISRNLFLGILSHDIRNPLGAILMSANLIPRIGPLKERQTALVQQITESGSRIEEIISHLLDITSVRLGSGLPVIKASADIGFIGRQLVEEMRSMHPTRSFELTVTGNTEGQWDKARIAQVFSNLLGNAIQYGFKNEPIHVGIRGEEKEITITVQNLGPLIPEDKLESIFDSLVRVTDGNVVNMTGETTNLGLGLYITKEIVAAHDGKITVTSTEKNGTTFTIRLPRG